jgi:signal transduction histidine kinase
MIRFHELTRTQQTEVRRYTGRASAISPEGLAFGIERYLSSLAEQAEAALSFYFGRIDEGLKRLKKLPEDVQDTIAKLIQELGSVEPFAVASAIMFSLELRMGIQDC